MNSIRSGTYGLVDFKTNVVISFFFVSVAWRLPKWHETNSSYVRNFLWNKSFLDCNLSKNVNVWAAQWPTSSGLKIREVLLHTRKILIWTFKDHKGSWSKVSTQREFLSPPSWCNFQKQNWVNCSVHIWRGPCLSISFLGRTPTV